MNLEIKKNEEMTKQMEAIYERNNDPEFQARKKAEIKKQRLTEEKVADLGLE